jgi:hypothetical protein
VVVPSPGLEAISKSPPPGGPIVMFCRPWPSLVRCAAGQRQPLSMTWRAPAIVTFTLTQMQVALACLPALANTPGRYGRRQRVFLIVQASGSSRDRPHQGV